MGYRSRETWVGCALVAGFLAASGIARGDELAALGQAIDQRPDDPAGYDAYAQAAFRAHQWDEAIARLKIGVAKIPSYHAGYYKLGYAYRQKHAFTDAADAYRQFSALEPDKADPYFGLAAALQGAGDRAGATAAYRRYLALEKAPEKQKFIDQAKAEIAKLDAVAASDGGVKPTPAPTPAPAPTPKPSPVPRPTPTPVPSPMPKPLPTPPPKPTPLAAPAPPRADALALRNEADKLRQAGRLDEASATYERALAADPGNLDLHVELGDSYFGQHRYTDAARVFAAAVERDAGYALGWYNLAHAQSRAGKHEDAVRAYREYIRLRPSDPDPYYGLGQTYKAMGDGRNAAEALRTYLKMERRPESQRWVDKAREQLDVIERAGPHARARDLKDPFADHPAYASADDNFPPSADGAQHNAHTRIQRELAADNILPIDEEAEERRARAAERLVDPFERDPFVADDAIPVTSRDKLARYAGALAAYRAALDHRATEVASLYQRGAERVLANDLRGAQRAWATAAVSSDPTIEEARQRLEKARQALQK